MKIGLVPENVYERSVKKILKFYQNKKGETAGVVSAFFSNEFENAEVIVTENYAALYKEMMTTKAIISSINELLVNKAEEFYFNLSLIMPEKYSEEKMKNILLEIQEVLDEVDGKVISFHGELVTYVKEPVLISTGIGTRCKIQKNNKDSSNTDIVLVGRVGDFGASVLAQSKKSELMARLTESYLKGAIVKPKQMIIKDEAALAVKSEDAKMFHVSEGGIYAALWNMAKTCKVGLEVNLKSIPIRQETVEICNFLDINPYELFSEGCLLVTIDDGDSLVNAYAEKEICAAVIGKITDNNDKVVINDYERKFLTKPCPDELARFL